MCIVYTKHKTDTLLGLPLWVFYKLTFELQDDRHKHILNSQKFNFFFIYMITLSYHFYFVNAIIYFFVNVKMWSFMSDESAAQCYQNKVNYSLSFVHKPYKNCHWESPIDVDNRPPETNVLLSIAAFKAWLVSVPLLQLVLLDRATFTGFLVRSVVYEFVFMCDCVWGTCDSSKTGTYGTSISRKLL